MIRASVAILLHQFTELDDALQAPERFPPNTVLTLEFPQSTSEIFVRDRISLHFRNSPSVVILLHQFAELDDAREGS